MLNITKINRTIKQGLNPWFVTGLIDAEGCFNIMITKTKSKLGWRVQAIFVIELHVKDVQLLYQIQTFFGGVGTVINSSIRKVSRYTIVGIKDINNKVLPHFDKYPLQSEKDIDLKYWKDCIIIMTSKGHLTQEGIEEIISNKTAMNKGISDKIRASFLNNTELVRPKYVHRKEMLEPNWICGFITGDGSFNVTINSKNQVGLKVSIALHQRERLLLERIQQ